MKKPILALCLSASCALVASAQQQESTASGQANVQTVAAASQADKRINLESGTTVTGQLQNAIDARHAKVGDPVVLKTTQAIKSEGRTIVNKGSRLIGHVTEVAQKGKDNVQSRIGILFDRLEKGSLQTPIAASITSVVSGGANVHANNDDLFTTDTMASGSARSTSSARSSGSNGSLLGGVGGVVNSTTSTVGSAVGGTTSAVGSTVNSTTNTVGSTAGRSLRGVQVSQSSSASVEGSSVLSLQGDNLRLEKGTSFNLIITQSTSAGTAKDQ
jgi:hypothetical protein